MRRVTCVMVNEDGEHDLLATLNGWKDLNYKITQGALGGPMPAPIAKSGGKGTFVLTQDANSTVGPSGWACYEVQNEVVFQIGFGDPAGGAGAFTIGFNYLEKGLEAAGRVTFAGPSGAIEPSKVAETTDLTVEFHCSTKPRPATATDAQPNAGSVQSVGAQPGGSSNVVLLPYIARWNQQKQGDQPAITERRMKVLAAVQRTYPLLYAPTTDPRRAVAPENGGGTYRNVGEFKGSGTSCNDTCKEVGGLVAPASSNNWNFQLSKERGAYIWWGDAKFKMPSVGDVYTLVRDEFKRPIDAGPKPTVARPRTVKKGDPPLDATEKDAQKKWATYDAKVAVHNPHQRHVGIIVEVGSDYFITADGGQKAHTLEAGHLVKRRFTRRKPGPSDAKHYEKWVETMKSAEFAFAKPLDWEQEALYLSGGAESSSPSDANRLVGWMSIDRIKSDRFNPTFKDDSWKASYETLGAIIEKMR